MFSQEAQRSLKASSDLVQDVNQRFDAWNRQGAVADQERLAWVQQQQAYESVIQTLREEIRVGEERLVEAVNDSERSQRRCTSLV